MPYTAALIMDELAARLEVLFRRHAKALEQRGNDGDPVVEQFQKQLRLLVAQYGQAAVEEALDRFCAGPELPSVSFH
jgi:hypothetical protein